MSLSKQKKLYYQLVNKGRNRERKEDWREAVAYVARKWMVCNFLMKLPDNFYSSVGGNFELWVLLGSFTRNVWNFSFDTFAKDFNCLCWIKITCLSATKYNVIFFIFFSLSSAVGKIISLLKFVSCYRRKWVNIPWSNKSTKRHTIFSD